jgi:hypothetical protein
MDIMEMARPSTITMRKRIRERSRRREQHGHQQGIVTCAARATGENRENAEAQRSALIPVF